MSYFKGPEAAVELPEFQPHTSVLKLLVEALRKNGNKTAYIEGQTGNTVTFQDFLQKSSAISVGLRDKGVTAGDYVIICCEKSIAAFSALLGVIFSGATAVMYPVQHVDTVPQMTKGFPVKAVFCDRQYLDSLTASMQNMKKPVLVAITQPQDQVFTSLLNSKGQFEVYDVKDVKKHVPLIFYSSGTTGIPKGIQVTDVSAQLCGRYLKVKMDTLFVTSPIFWLSAWVTMVSSILQCFRALGSNSTDPKENLKLLEKYKVDIWFAGTGSLPGYINEPTLSSYDLSALEGVAVGGEVVLSSVAHDFRNKVLRGNAKLISGYGSTECGLVCNLELDWSKDKFEYGLCGKVNAGVEIKIVDEQGNIVPIGTMGEVLVKSPGITTGYWGLPELNQKIFDDRGFFRSDDVGFFNKEGEIYIRGRIGDLINYKGVKISPAEVEDILLAHPAVKDAAVVGKSHPTDIQLMTAYVVKVPGSKVTAQELQTLVDGKVEDNMRLRGGVHFLDILPRTIIGKIIRKTLREL